VVIPLLVLVLVGTHESAEHQSNLVRELDAVGYVLAALAAVSVVRRRAAPLEALFCCGAVTAAYLGIGYPWGPVVVPLALLATAPGWFASSPGWRPGCPTRRSPTASSSARRPCGRTSVGRW
jgi:hypothetical protein